MIGLTAILGAIIAILVSQIIPHLTTFVIPFAAGSFIYIAGSDLVPELHKESNAKKSAVQLLISIFGVGVMMALLLLEYYNQNTTKIQTKYDVTFFFVF